MPIGSPDPFFDDLHGVSCTRPPVCTAVGEPGAQLARPYGWNGSTWRIIPTPTP
jgi:hypothetical protein